MRGKRYSLIKLASAFLLRKLLPRSVKSKTLQNSKLKVLGDIYKEYKALKIAYPKADSHLRYPSKKFKRGRMIQRSTSSDEVNNSGHDSDSYIPPSLSRRQRLLGLAKTTRDSYMPKFALLASGVSSTLSGDYYDENGNVRVPKDAYITLFPTYTRKGEGNKYHVDVKGSLSSPGVMTRKNRLILSLAKQITRYGSNPTATKNAINQLENESMKQGSANSSDVESSSENSSLGTISNSDNSATNRPTTDTMGDEMLKERLSSFIARAISNASLSVVIGSHDKLDLKKLRHEQVVTDSNGFFEICLDTEYEPSVIQVKSATDESIFAFQDIMLIPNGGLGIISDIDDTIKLTGVIGDKRELMRNLLLKDVSQWNIPPVVKWYIQLYDHNGISFHYVSNSPWQLFHVIDKYFRNVKLPVGSIHLKQYTGSFISSLMEPSSSRKKRHLNKIAEDFPDKKFICVGDSGEYDLEAYVDLARAYPSQVQSIYIRYVEGSLSDIDDIKILKELTRITTSKKKAASIAKEFSSKEMDPEEIENLIDLSDSPAIAADRLSKLPPMIPNKPNTLKGKKLGRKPPLPIRDELKRSHTDTELSDSDPMHTSNERTSSWKDLTDVRTVPDDEDAPPIPRRKPTTSVTTKTHAEGFTSTSDNDYNVFDNLQSVYNTHHYYDLEDMDKRGAQWIKRVIAAMGALEGTDTEIRIFTDDEHDFFKSSLDIVRDYLSDKK